MTKALTLDEINRMRQSITGGSIKVENVVENLMENIVEGASNDYMMAQYALISNYLLRVGKTDLGKSYIQKMNYYSDYALDKISLVDAYVLRGNYEYLMDEYGQAAVWYYRALELSESIGFDGELGRIYNNIGTLFLNNRAYEMCLEFYLLSEKYSQRIRDKRNLPILYNNLSKLYLLSKDYEEASKYIKKAEFYIKEHGSIIRKLNLSINKWRFSLSQGDMQECLDYYEQSRTLLVQLPDGNDKVVATLAVFDNLIEMDMCELAIHKLETDIQYFEGLTDHFNLKKFYNHLITYYDSVGNIEMKQEYVTKSYQSDNEITKDLFLQRLNTLKMVDNEYNKRKDEREKNVVTLASLSEENKQLSAVNNKLRVIHDIGLAILSTTEFEEIYNILLCRVNEMFQINQFGIAIYDGVEDNLIFSYTYSDNHSSIKTIRLPLDNCESYSAKAFLENKEIIINDLEKESPEDFKKSLKYGDQVASLIYIPIQVNNKPFGVMTVQHQQRNAFTSLHLEVFRLLGTFASVSFKNAQHNQTLNDINNKLNYLAKHDELTSLYNRITFEKVYDEAYEESLLNESPLTIMILDIDAFKLYNDHYGHLMGDKCISLIAKTLQNNLKRNKDLIARYGGDEFMVLLPDTDVKGAECVVQLFREAIKALAIVHETSEISEIITLSIGAVTTVVKEGTDKESLLITADKALYKVKKEMGRNYYCIENLV